MPLIFAPMVLTSYGDRCRTTLPKWVAEAQNSRDASPLLKASAEAIVRYRNGSVPFIKLLDGGVVDFYGLSGFTITRLAAETPYEPLTARQAAKLRRVLFLVVDAGRGPSGNWAQSVEGPNAPELLMAAGRYGDRVKRPFKLYGLRPHHVGMARDAGALALRFIAG